jgi:di/tricarboxylate transporter
MAANPLAANLTASTIGEGIGWTLWAKAAIVPGLLSLVIVPLVLYVIYPPEVKSSPDAPRLAKEKLATMGPMSKEEKIMGGTLLLTVSYLLCFLSAISLFEPCFRSQLLLIYFLSANLHILLCYVLLVWCCHQLLRFL